MTPNIHAALSILKLMVKSPNSLTTDMLSSFQYRKVIKENAVFIRTNMKFMIFLTLSFFTGNSNSRMPNTIGMMTGSRMK
jgi:hypothetical protein